MRLSVIAINGDDDRNSVVSKTSSILNRVSSLGRADKPKLNPASVPKSISRDNLKIINEKNLSGAPNYKNHEDEDSETEKLSPLLLNNKVIMSKLKDDTALKMTGVEDPIDEDSDGDDMVKPVKVGI